MCSQWPRFPRRSTRWIRWMSRSAARGSLYRHHFGEPDAGICQFSRGRNVVLRRPALRVLEHFCHNGLRCYDPADGCRRGRPLPDHRAATSSTRAHDFCWFCRRQLVRIWQNIGKPTRIARNRSEATGRKSLIGLIPADYDGFMFDGNQRSLLRRTYAFWAL